ncbi:MAG: pyridoxine 5'-phosphate synthase [Alphaproteobacteria bacterium]|nr:pyridoxine 5'-phosphate synthase [Alphaproteobacteria bacterium]
MRRLRLGINIDHVATLRNARGDVHPEIMRAAHAALAGGADSITVHLREDRRHIRDTDVERLCAALGAPINMEMAATAEMAAIALRLKPHAVCIVPERREELTTEGGLDVKGKIGALQPVVTQLAAAGIQVAPFIDPDIAQVDAVKAAGAQALEFHTGVYCNARGGAQTAALKQITDAARHAAAIGIEVHAGHGLNFDNVGPIAAIAEIEELNIGHYLVGEALFTGLEAAVRRMRAAMDAARGGKPA